MNEMRKPSPIEPGKYGLVTVHPAWNPLALELRPGDIFLTWLDTELARGIILLTAFFSPDREAEYNHAGIISGFGGWSLEALWFLESWCIFEQHEGKKILIYRWPKLTDELLLQAHDYTNKHIGQFYPIHRLALHMLNLAHIFHWHRLVCSEYAAKHLKGMGARKRRYYGTTPDHLADESRDLVNAEGTGRKYQTIKKGGLPFNYYQVCFSCMSVRLVPYRISTCPGCGDPLVKDFYSTNNSEVLEKAHLYNQEKKKWVASQIKKKRNRKKKRKDRSP